MKLSASKLDRLGFGPLVYAPSQPRKAKTIHIGCRWTGATANVWGRSVDPRPESAAGSSQKRDCWRSGNPEPAGHDSVFPPDPESDILAAIHQGVERDRGPLDLKIHVEL